MLSELVNMSAPELFDFWFKQNYPFDAMDCGGCLTCHIGTAGECHPNVRQALAHLNGKEDFRLGVKPEVIQELCSAREAFAEHYPKTRVAELATA